MFIIDYYPEWNMSLEKKLVMGGMIIGGIAGAIVGLDYSWGRFDLADMKSFWWQAQAKATTYIPFISTAVGALMGKYVGMGIGKVVEEFRGE